MKIRLTDVFVYGIGTLIMIVFIFQLSKVLNTQDLIVPEASNYTINVEVVSIDGKGRDSEQVIGYKVIESDSPKIRIGGTGKLTLTNRMNLVQREDLSEVGAMFSVSCLRRGEQVFCSFVSENFATEYEEIYH